MNVNPYAPGNANARVNRTPLVLAAIGAWAAAGYWALLTALLVFGAAMGSVSGLHVILPVVLIGFYAYRGVQMFKGDRRAARALLWLHGLGGIIAVLNVMSASGLLVVLQGVKVVIHIFGVVTVLMARRTLDAMVASGDALPMD